MSSVIIDSNFLLGLMDSNDKWNDKAFQIFNSLKSKDFNIIYFDCVIIETISVLARRLEEKQRSNEFSNLVDHLNALIPEQNISWILTQAKNYYDGIILLMKEHNGILNFHDCLIALIARQHSITYIASFDKDFDKINWIERISETTI
ncbi:type II toxin-antitoxin system VapC family toxin [candidate division KSB1 bacterium]|nr:type II toxin-antitoxin system VapC family toxin [candidate division KSB1 bacterium]